MRVVPARPSSRAAVAVASLAALGLALIGCQWDGPSAGVAAGPPSTAPRTDVSQSDDTAGGDEPTASDSDGSPSTSAPDSSDSASGATDSTDTSDVPDADSADQEPDRVDDAPRVSAPRPPSTDPADERYWLDVERPHTVAVVGDSLTESATEEITAYLEGVGIQVLIVDGAVNRRMTHGDDPSPGIDEIDAIASVADPDLWVIALGTNDVGSQVNSREFQADVATTLDHIPDDAAVVWVDIWIRDRKPAVERANDDLRQVVLDRPDTYVADWFSHGDDHGIITADGVHLTADGKHVFAQTIVDAVYSLYT